MKKILLFMLLLSVSESIKSSDGLKPVQHEQKDQWLSFRDYFRRLKVPMKSGRCVKDNVIDNQKLYQAWLAGNFSLYVRENRELIPLKKHKKVICNSYLVNKECELRSYIHRESGIVVNGYSSDGCSSMTIAEPCNVSDFISLCHYLVDYIPNENHEFKVGTIVKPLTLIGIKSVLGK